MPDDTTTTPPAANFKDAAKNAAAAGGRNLIYTGAGTTVAGSLVVVGHRFGIQMTAEEAVAWVVLSTVFLTPAVRVFWSLFSQWLAHRNYTLPDLGE